MAREDKASATSSLPGDQDSTSLAARRARLRGTLSKQIVPPDPYGTDAAAAADSSEDSDNSSPVSVDTGAGATAAPIANPSVANNPLAGLSATASYTQAPAPVLPIETVSKEGRGKGKGADSASPAEQPFGNSPIAGYNNAITSTNSAGSSGNGSNSSTKSGKAEAFAIDNPGNPGNFTPDMQSTNTSSNSSVADKAGSSKTSSESSKVKTGNDEGGAITKSEDKAPGFTGSVDAAAIAEAVNAALNKGQIVELLNNIDTQVGICSVNVAQLAKSANEQLEVVRALSELVQNQAFGEIGLSLNSLSESMSAALEPMKAVGELVPAIDNLVTSIQNGAVAGKSDAPKLTPDELVMSLANQLSNQQIDPWTFKCAYMAVFPSEHPADLLRKLVDLLGTQTLSGDLFRAAYDAVQAPDPPRPVYTQHVAGEEGVREVVKIVQDEAVLAQIEELRNFNEELRQRMDQREGEYAEMLAAKESEVQETQSTLTARFEEFNGRYEEVSELVRQRNDEISQKDSEILQKDSELQILRSQLDEMREQTHSMVADLQRQLTTTQQAVEEASKVKPAPLTKAQTNFFEATSTPAPQAPQAQLFSEPAPQPAFSGTPGGIAPGVPMNTAPLPAQEAPPPAPQMPAAPAPSVTQAELQPVADSGNAAGLAGNLNPSISNQAIPRPQVAAPTTPMMGTGSYGSGVRAQVFEVIVRQALAGAPWREICAGPMQVNNISPDEVEGEVKRRQALLKK